MEAELKDLDKKRVAVCFVYGEDGKLYLHCVGHATFQGTDLSVDRDEGDDPFVVANHWKLTIRTAMPRESAGKLRDAEVLVAIHVTPLSDLQGKKLVLLLWESDDDAYVVAGDLECQEHSLRLNLGPDIEAFFINRDWWPRIRAVPDDIRDILLGADLLLPLRVGSLPEGAPACGFKLTGLRIPS